MLNLAGEWKKANGILSHLKLQTGIVPGMIFSHREQRTGPVTKTSLSIPLDHNYLEKVLQLASRQMIVAVTSSYLLCNCVQAGCFRIC